MAVSGHWPLAVPSAIVAAELGDNVIPGSSARPQDTACLRTPSYL